MANWFLPFSAAHSAVSPLFENFSGEAFASMADATEMCSADRFSFALGILQMPADRREMLAGHLNGQLEAMRDLLKDRENVGRKPLFAAEALSFARDLYRFAKVYPKHTEYPDPFAEPLDFLHLPYLGALLADDEIIETAADFYFNHGYHSLAASLYEEAAGRGVAERELYEKLGYSYQMLGDFRRALESYERADLFSSDADRSSTWLLRKLAFANRALGNFSAAADYYRRLLERTPDDLSLEFRLAGLLLQAGDLKGAGERAAKLCYLNPDHAGYRKLSGRIKAHEAFIDGNYGEAAGLYAIDRIGLTDEQETAWRRELAAELRRIDPKADVALLLLMLDSDVGNPE
ncbi:MAG: hypothetical protein J1F07_09760, partial [Muribaculaceae bacterium]|nr:hypothetical protein [Muribaculaceae bacterium]